MDDLQDPDLLCDIFSPSMIRMIRCIRTFSHRSVLQGSRSFRNRYVPLTRTVRVSRACLTVIHLAAYIDGCQSEVGLATAARAQQDRVNIVYPQHFSPFLCVVSLCVCALTDIREVPQSF